MRTMRGESLRNVLTAGTVCLVAGASVLAPAWLARQRSAARYLASTGPLVAVNGSLSIGDIWAQRDFPWKLVLENVGG
jgi:hypothetical protein